MAARPRFRRATPVLAVRDYPRARAFYRDVLGFEVIEEGGDPPGFGILRRDGATVFLDAACGEPVRRTGAIWSAYLHVFGLARVRDELVAKGVELCEPLHETTYGMLELELEDPDGNRLCLGSDVGPCHDIVRNQYVLAVHDLDATRAWYEAALGCTSEEVDPGNWLFLRTSGVVFMVGRCPDATPAGALGDHSYFAYLVVDEVDALAERAQAAGAEFIKPLRDEPWDMREFGLRSVDGHRIMIGAPI